eukprot:TRINITY_DN25160_c0_g2_i1.p1 TRINITY_DN25160_c0_g2~~TRINITY_DN25160_c0_g2_i1.p1  ORF type:complete len:585 (+),score=98.82 TRINITY_DN25160_c0_g2_i1:104-1858(+)
MMRDVVNRVPFARLLISVVALLGDSGIAEDLHFVQWPHADVCWRAGRVEECCSVELEESTRRGCWDDYFTHDRCCSSTVSHQSVPEDECVSSAPLLRPSVDEPFLFLWDEKAGGSTFNRWLLESSALEGMLAATHISDFWWPNILGSPYFLKLFGEQKRRQLSIVSGTFDWRAVEGLCLPRQSQPEAPEQQQRPHGSRLPAGGAERRRVRCFVLLRDPVDRFISYWLERSDRILLRDDRTSLADVPLDELRAYLASVRADSMPLSGNETGVGCNREVGLCLQSPSDGRRSDVSDVEPPETEGFRMLRGPQNRLARMLDPEGRARPRFAVAAERLRRCTVGVIDAAHRSDLRAVLAHRAPWIREVLMDERSDVHVADIFRAAEGDTAAPPRTYSRNRGSADDGNAAPAPAPRPEEVVHKPRGIRDAMRNHWYGSESRWVRRNLSAAARQLIADYNDVDMPLYYFGVEVFRRQAAEARLSLALARSASESASAAMRPTAVSGAVKDITLNTTFLENHSWAHHFDQLGLHATRFMTDGLRCILTGRAMPCARFLRVEWPDDRDIMLPPDELRQLIQNVYPDGAVYLL